MKIKWSGQLSVLLLPFDQVLSAATNAIPIVLLSRALSAREFGVVAIAYTLISGVGVLVRAWTATPLLVGPAASSQENGIDGGGRGESAAVHIAVLAGILVALSGVAYGIVGPMPPAARVPVVILSMGAPFAYGSEVCRYQLISSQRIRQVLEVDGRWFLITAVLAAGGVAAAGDLRSLLWSAMWPLGAVAALRCGMRGAGYELNSSRQALWAWAKATRRSGSMLVLEATLVVARVQVFLLLIAAVAGVAVAGSYRLAGAFVAPILTGAVGVRHYFVLQERNKPGGIPLLAYPAVAAFGALCIGIVVAAPDSWLKALAGSTRADVLLIGTLSAALLAAIDSIVLARLMARAEVSTLIRGRLGALLMTIGVLVAARPTDEQQLNLVLIISAALASSLWLLIGRSGHAERHV